MFYAIFANHLISKYFIVDTVSTIAKLRLFPNLTKFSIAFSEGKTSAIIWKPHGKTLILHNFKAK
jgi:hypothetical protein